ncbi:MAG TPA: cyclic nucleotide-binding domain-containing protein, partial [Candidatus Angelobacter sp.]|nr:cyclic nucleotide-binding domain-containing protein [Candidatus Angelobacter sp.]
MKPAISVRRRKKVFRPAAFLATTGLGRTILELKKGQAIFTQGDDANAVFYIQKGRIRLTVISKRGKEATISLLGSGNFLGEECIATVQPLRLATATALTPATVLRIERSEMVRVLREEKLFSEVFVAYLLARNARIQEDLVDQLF